MADVSYYGEVVQVNSRAVDEDEDQDDAESPQCYPSAVLKWSPEVQKYLDSELTIPCTVLIISVGSAATGFIKSHFLYSDAERIGGIFTGLSPNSENTFNQQGFTDETCYIYRLKTNPSYLFCQCKTNVQPEQAFSFVKQLITSISLDNTYISVLDNKSVHEFKSPLPASQLQVPFLRSLKTGYFQGTPVCPYLEQPNIVDGLTAQLLTYCQMKGIPAVYYCCYSENMFLDVPTITAFRELLTTTPYKDLYQENDKCVEMMLQLVEQKNKSVTLYM